MGKKDIHFHKELLTSKGKTTKETWEEYIRSGRVSDRVQPGLSCFENFGQLLFYWNLFYKDCGGIEYSIYDNPEDHYILVFEGEYVSEGPSGEDCVKFIREIERVDLDEIVPIVEFWKHFKDHAADVLLYENYEGIHDLLDIVASYSDEDWLTAGMEEE